MTSDVTVFVVFDLEELPTPVDIRSAWLHISREQPRWSIGEVGHQSFRLGRYDSLPVLVTLRRGVFEESKLMTERMEADAPIRQRIALGSARFEFFWDLREDSDVVPETATLLVACAQALARLTKGVILVGGARVVPEDEEFCDEQAFSVLFPK